MRSIQHLLYLVNSSKRNESIFLIIFNHLLIIFKSFENSFLLNINYSGNTYLFLMRFMFAMELYSIKTLQILQLLAVGALKVLLLEKCNCAPQEFRECWELLQAFQSSLAESFKSNAQLQGGISLIEKSIKSATKVSVNSSIVQVSFITSSNSNRAISVICSRRVCLSGAIKSPIASV